MAECRESAQSVACPPTAFQGGRAHHADDRDAVLQKGNQAGPHRNSAHEVLGAVDRVDDPLAAFEDRCSALFLTEDRITGPLVGQEGADLGFDRLVGASARSAATALVPVSALKR
jgi:hypothetical protein